MPARQGRQQRRERRGAQSARPPSGTRIDETLVPRAATTPLSLGLSLVPLGPWWPFALLPPLEHRCFPQIGKRHSSGPGYENRCGPICQETYTSLTGCNAKKWLYNGESGGVTGKSN